MAIIKNKSTWQKRIIKARVDETIVAQIEDYCKWSGIFDLGYFIEEAADYIFKKDIDWKQYKKEKLGTST